MNAPDGLARRGSPLEVFAAFLRLGLTAFGGPIAHLGYFRSEFVLRRRWLDEAGYADLVALCQFLPGPASSQVGFALGLQRAGSAGAIAAWCGFTLPSALLMTAFAYVAASLSSPIAVAALHGLKIVAVAVVAQAVLGMARTLAPDRRRVGIAAGAVCLIVFAGSAVGQLVALGLGAVAGLFLCRRTASAAPSQDLRLRVPPWAGVGALIGFTVLFVAPYVLPPTGAGSAFSAFYRAGALVFGGGHVVLPLLQTSVVQPGWVAEPAFLAGYGATQALPGPLFTFGAYLGALSRVGPGGVAGASLALAAIFLPGLLLLIGALPFWDRLRRYPAAQAAMQGANAAVVGILGAALYDPVWTSAIGNSRDFALALVAFTALTAFRAPPIAVVVGTVCFALLLGV